MNKRVGFSALFAFVMTGIIAGCSAKQTFYPPTPDAQPEDPPPAHVGRSAPAAEGRPESGWKDAPKEAASPRLYEPAPKTGIFATKPPSVFMSEVSADGRTAEELRRLALELERAGRYEQLEATLAAEAISDQPTLLRMRATAREILGKKAAAVSDYLELRALADDIEGQEITARIGYLIDNMTESELSDLAVSDPFGEEAGYAGLKLAKLAIVRKNWTSAQKRLDELEAVFAGTPLGAATRELAGVVRGRMNVTPGLIGLLLPLSGPLAPYGRSALRGALVGSSLLGEGSPERIDTLTGVPLPEVRLAVSDSSGDPATVARAVDELARRGVVGIVGPLKGSVIKRAGERARFYGIPLLAPSPAENVAGGNTFRLYMGEREEVTALVTHAMDRLSMRSFAIVHPDSDRGYLYRDLFWDEVVSRGGEIVGSQPFGEEDTDIEKQLLQITGRYGLTQKELLEKFLVEELARLVRERDLLTALGVEGGVEEVEPTVDKEAFAKFKPKPQVDFEGVFMPSGPLKAAQMAPQIPYFDIEGVRLLGIRSWNYPALPKVGGEYVEGALFADAYHPAFGKGREFAEHFRRIYETAPSYFEASVHDTVLLMVADSTPQQLSDRGALSRKLATLWAAPGATGPLTSLPDGDISPAPKVLTVKRGRIVPAR